MRENTTLVQSALKSLLNMDVENYQKLVLHFYCCFKHLKILYNFIFESIKVYFTLFFSFCVRIQLDKICIEEKVTYHSNEKLAEFWNVADDSRKMKVITKNKRN